MRKKIALLVLFLALAARLPCGQGNAFSAEAPKTPDFKEANALYEAGKFREAAAAYGSIADEKKGGVAVFYDLANAELRSGNKGKARLWYERALKVDPRDPDVLWNLQVLKNALTDRIEPPLDPLAVGFFLKMFAERYTADESAMAVSGLLTALAIFSFLGWKVPSIKIFSGIFRALLLFSFGAALFLFGLKWTQVKDPSVIVLAKEVTARYGPTNRETKAFIVHEGARARVVDSTKDWFYARLDDGNEGWLPKSACETV